MYHDTRKIIDDEMARLAADPDRTCRHAHRSSEPGTPCTAEATVAVFFVARGGGQWGAGIDLLCAPHWDNGWGPGRRLYEPPFAFARKDPDTGIWVHGIEPDALRYYPD